MSTNTRNLLVLGGLIAFTALMRLLPHPPNVAAVAPVALFAGWFFTSRWLALAAPLGAMLVSDSLIGGYHPGVMLAVYASLAAPVLFRPLMGDGSSARRLLGGAAVGAVAGSALFFIVSNLAVWVFSGWYARSWAGLVECYAAALPFLKYTAGGDLAYAMTLFGGYAAVRTVRGAMAPRRLPVESARGLGA